MSRLKPYTIISPYGDGKTLVQVFGEKAILGGYESYEFIIFRAIDIQGAQPNWRRFWVAEKTSGMICHNVPPYRRSKESAIEAARLRIREQNSIDENALDNAIKVGAEFRRRLERADSPAPASGA